MISCYQAVNVGWREIVPQSSMSATAFLAVEACNNTNNFAPLSVQMVQEPFLVVGFCLQLVPETSSHKKQPYKCSEVLH